MTGAAIKSIFSVAPIEEVITTVTGERVVTEPSVENILTAATVDSVVSTIAIEPVVSIETIDHIGTRITDDFIRQRGACQIGRGIAASGFQGLNVGAKCIGATGYNGIMPLTDILPDDTEWIIDNVQIITGSANHGVDSALAIDLVVAGCAYDEVRGVTAEEGQGNCPGGPNLLDLGIGRHGKTDTRIDDVIAAAGSLKDAIIPITNDVCVVSRSAVQSIRACAPV